MEGIMSASDEQQLVSSFLEIVVGQTADTARQFLQATSWKLEDAIQLFYVGNEDEPTASTSNSPPLESVNSWAKENSGEMKDPGNNRVGLNDGDEVRPPLPVVREKLYDDAILYGASRIEYPLHESRTMIAFRNFEQEIKRPGVWQSSEGAPSAVDAPCDNLASLYRPPYHLMFHGTFEKAKDAASLQEKWLLVNLQSTKEFSSHMLNRDTWANEAVSQTISTNFIFWQVYNDSSEGRKVCTYYKLDSIPVVLVVDPITGQKMRSWCGMVQPESLLEDLVPFMDGGPRDHHEMLSHKRQRGNSLIPQQKTKVDTPPTDETYRDKVLSRPVVAPMESIKDSSKLASIDRELYKAEETLSTTKPTYPLLPEEPKGDRSLLCRVGIRLPDGQRVQRNFLRTDPIQLLWSFCQSQLGENEAKAFRLAQPIPGASKSLDYDSKLTFNESGLPNSMIVVTWE